MLRVNGGCVAPEGCDFVVSVPTNSAAVRADARDLNPPRLRRQNLLENLSK